VIADVLVEERLQASVELLDIFRLDEAVSLTRLGQDLIGLVRSIQCAAHGLEMGERRAFVGFAVNPTSPRLQ
jgi:hypothetical protein